MIPRGWRRWCGQGLARVPGCGSVQFCIDRWWSLPGHCQSLYEFSQVNNHEMGVLVDRSQSRDLYMQIYDEAMRIVRLSDEIRVKVARVPKAPVEDPRPGEAPTCPKCNETMVVRTARKGANKGETFWGCSTFPKCWGMRPLETAQAAPKTPSRRGFRSRRKRS